MCTEKKGKRHDTQVKAWEFKKQKWLEKKIICV